MSKENKNLKDILNNNWFNPEFKPIIVKYGWVNAEKLFSTGQFESFDRTLKVTKEEFESVEWGDYIREENFNIRGLEFKMDANIFSSHADEGTYPTYSLGINCYPKIEMKFSEKSDQPTHTYMTGNDGSLSANEVWELWENDSDLYFDSIWKSGYYYKVGENVYFTCGDPTCCWDEYTKEQFLKLDDRFSKQDE